MAKRNHIHKYKRINLSNEGEYLVLKCLKPDCSHYVPVSLAIGAICECNRCSRVMVIDKATILLALPHCKDCTKSKKSEQVADIAAFLEGKV